MKNQTISPDDALKLVRESAGQLLHFRQTILDTTFEHVGLLEGCRRLAIYERAERRFWRRGEILVRSVHQG